MEGHSSVASLVLVLVLILTALNCNGFPNGAPNSHRVCEHLRPGHHGAKPQRTPPPYSILPEKTNISSDSWKVKLIAHPGFLFKGFIMQARSEKGRHKLLGSFRIVDTSLTKTLSCFYIENNTVTHQSPVLKKEVTFVWKSPTKYRGSVFFTASVVQNFSTFWMNVSAEIAVGHYDLTKDIRYDKKKITPFVVSSGAEDSFDNEVDSLNRRIYRECGVSKTCFGVPDDCVSTRSCDALATVVARESKYEFEMVGTGYVAVSLSEDGHLDEVSATECMMVDNAVVRLYQSRYYASEAGRDAIPTYKELELVNSSFWDGMVYCKFVRNEFIELDGVQYNFKSKKYFILLASEDNARILKENNRLASATFQSSERNYLSNVSGFCTSPLSKNEKKNRVVWGLLLLDFILGIIFSVFCM